MTSGAHTVRTAVKGWQAVRADLPNVDGTSGKPPGGCGWDVDRNECPEDPDGHLEDVRASTIRPSATTASTG